MDITQPYKSFWPVLLFVIIAFFGCNPRNPASDGEKQEKTATDSRFELKKCFTIGVQEADTEDKKPYQFAYIYGIDCDPGGRIYALDGRLNNVRVFTPTGEFVRQMFRPGSGPDEIASTTAISFNPFNNTFYVMTGNGYVLKQFTPEGQNIREFKLNTQFFSEMCFLSDNQFLFIPNARNGTKIYNNFEVLGLPDGKVVEGYLPASMEERSHLYNNFQKMALANGLLWSSPINAMTLFAVDLKTKTKVREVPFPGAWKNNKLHEFDYNGMRAVGAIPYNILEPAALDGEICCLLTVREFDFKKPTKEAMLPPQSWKTSIYHVAGGEKIIKTGDLRDCDYARFEAAYKNRLLFFVTEPYPHIAVWEVQKKQAPQA